MVLCIICALRAHANDRVYLGEKDDGIATHNLRCHPDPTLAAMERRELEGWLEERRLASHESAR